jgi:hypothetical protein
VSTTLNPAARATSSTPVMISLDRADTSSRTTSSMSELDGGVPPRRHPRDR